MASTADTNDILNPKNQLQSGSWSDRSDETCEEVKHSHKRPWSMPIDYEYVPDLACRPESYDEQIK